MKKLHRRILISVYYYKYYLIFLVLVNSLANSLLFAQNTSKQIETDSSVIEIKYFKYLNSIREFNELKNIRKTYFKDIYYDTKNLRTKGIYINGNCVGKWEYYTNEGILEEVIDYDNGKWTVMDKNQFPFYDLQSRIKEIGDNIVRENYGAHFFDKCIVFSINHSAIYNENESGDWNERFKMPPNEFLLRYDIRLNDEEYYEEMIEFTLDSLGNLIFPFNLYTDIKGFEKINFGDSLIITKSEAISKSIELGLVEFDSNKAFCFLEWIYYDNQKIDKYNGHFTYNVLIKKETLSEIKPEGRSRIVEKFDAYIFNPWTKDFEEKKKLKTIYEYEKLSGFKSGYLPDE